ncbi:hypothetical protein KIPB_003645 [Kipferlia bialata]|uniref:Uncharacterized protein n=1 Tax=Kipferlia bialata TaxID=797122 RepID=A0A9K3CUD4_9EUKA|nr:hypothetical protein KIPB_003645 [Kipferlia bialata]|eukprot:g3645.t1
MSSEGDPMVNHSEHRRAEILQRARSLKKDSPSMQAQAKPSEPLRPRRPSISGTRCHPVIFANCGSVPSLLDVVANSWTKCRKGRVTPEMLGQTSSKAAPCHDPLSLAQGLPILGLEMYTDDLDEEPIAELSKPEVTDKDQYPGPGSPCLSSRDIMSLIDLSPTTNPIRPSEREREGMRQADREGERQRERERDKAVPSPPFLDALEPEKKGHYIPAVVDRRRSVTSLRDPLFLRVFGSEDRPKPKASDDPWYTLLQGGDTVYGSLFDDLEGEGEGEGETSIKGERERQPLAEAAGIK